MPERNVTKYYCDKCIKEKGMTKKFRKVYHKCDGCGVECICSDDKPVQPYKRGK